MANNKEKELPVDKSPATVGQSDHDANEALRQEYLDIAEAQELTFENVDSDEPTEVRVGRGLPINPSSTYPGRDKELAENDMRIPTVIDAAKRAAFAGTQWPAMAANAGLSEDDFSFSQSDADAATEEEAPADNG